MEGDCNEPELTENRHGAIVLNIWALGALQNVRIHLRGVLRLEEVGSTVGRKQSQMWAGKASPCMVSAVIGETSFDLRPS